ncbi:MAG: methyltransferase domain-containing protein [Xenococcaceae cyanobacterium MO_167.B27]|nr:methyltransferase domain-containing protein [Xenococcaceae cyanobacterium MO_167.B27]
MNMDYIHGYSDDEQKRLIQQAEYWKNDLIVRDINYNSGESLLEIGCGAGAVLGILGTAFPGLKFSGIDLEAKQINFASQHLKQLGLDADLKIGNASNLPWQDNSFDHVYAIWFLEHLSNPLKVLQEAIRVLKPGGTITLTETDYRTIVISPDSENYLNLNYSLCELLIQSGGNPYMGQSLGNLLTQSGFKTVVNNALTFHYFSRQDPKKVTGFIDYVSSWLAPTIPQIVEKFNKDSESLSAGLNDFHNVKNNPDGAVTAVIYRATGIK